MTKIAFIKFAGLASGGCEKYLQTIACILSKNNFEVDYYYTNSAPYINWNSPFVHADNDESRKKILENHNINLIKVHVQNKDGIGPPYNWINTDFWNLFNEDKYDCISSARSGYPEYPFHKIHKTKIIDTIHSDIGEDKENIHKAILLCEWQAERWGANGGNINKATVIPSLVEVPIKKESTLRKELNIPEDAFVYGFHQGDREDVFSPISLIAYNEIKNSNNYFLIMGGAQQYRALAQKINHPNIKFVDFSSSVERIHNFLGSLNVFAHARHDGEVCSAAIIEALYHGKPVISHLAMNMGHKEQITGCGLMTQNIPEYVNEMYRLENDAKYYHTKVSRSLERYKTKYDYHLITQKILDVYSEI